ncbi:formate dehydrogenase accessory protein FdhE [Natroniella sulfidigena]|uniref:formate dehydrogenase accessory protein FdhE n=1 Tax=Natroniella sulfidigena TaxID=723921 RepID=UPI002009EA10|nr:formate dehydrogenase accessory protein FdhE [Natroniella sulfidigena]MCK8815959.1 formate dehydrogenase accessory protein FdhE [Natroniella sulfidigena]
MNTELKLNMVELPTELIKFITETEDITNQIEFEVEKEIIADEVIKEHKEKKTPLFHLQTPKIEGRLFKTAFSKVCELLPDKQDDSLSKQFNQLLAEDNQFWGQLGRKMILQQEDVIKELTIEKEIPISSLLLVLLQSLRIFLKEYSQFYQRYLEQGEWKEEKCPLCGWPPLIGHFIAGDDTFGTQNSAGAKSLFCPLCDTDWLYSRLHCSSCGEQFSKGKQNYFYVEGNDGLIVNHCSKCNSYLKILDERKLNLTSPKSPWMLYLETLHLDFLAEKRDYSSNLNLFNEKN